MTVRNIIEIDEEKCNGCGNCITGCAEGALAIVDGKARLVKEQYCDGLGACLGDCPTGALKIIQKDADAFDEAEVEKHLAKQKLVKNRKASGCPGSQQKSWENAEGKAPAQSGSGVPAQVIPSELRQWPVQLHLVQPQADIFKDKELVVLSTCSPVTSADVHWRFLRGRSVVVACPKLDRTEGYVEKLADILSEPSIPKVIIVRMEVPCCGGLTAIVNGAIAGSGRMDLDVEEVTVNLNGDISC